MQTVQPNRWTERLMRVSYHTLVLGLAAMIVSFAFIYFFLSYTGEANSLSNLTHLSPFKRFLDCLYFSVITTTTVGYGDIIPHGVSRFFTAIHVQGRRFNSDADVLAYVKEQGVDADRFSNLVKSFQVTTKANRARQLTDAYKIDGVPTVGVHGRFYTSAALAGSHERALAVVDVLMQRIRQNKA